MTKRGHSLVFGGGANGLMGAAARGVKKGNGYIYISDKDANGVGRVVVCDPNFIYQYTISDFVNAQGVPDTLKSPEGLFIYEDSLYVCDKENSRIVILVGFKSVCTYL